MLNIRLIAFILLVISITVFASSCRKLLSVTVIVKNDSTVTLKNMEISFKGGSKKLDSLKPGKSYRVAIQSKGPSAIYIKFVANKSVIKKAVPGSYIETGYFGNITVTVDNKFNFKVDNKIKPW